MRESFIHEVFILLYGDEYIYEGYSYDDAIKKIKSLIKESEESTVRRENFAITNSNSLHFSYSLLSLYNLRFI